MRQRLAVLIGSLLALAGITAGLLWLEPRCRAPMPEPSVPAGYYQEAFVLTLSAPEGGTIYYTTDGSEPSPQSAVYTDGIRIENRSDQPNVYNAVQNVVADWKNYVPNSTPVEKGTVVRAIFVSDWGAESDILTQTYFVGIPQPEDRYTLSLVFEPDELFGTDGIYVTGTDYDAWYSAAVNPDPDEVRLNPMLNYLQDLEIPAVVQILGEDGEILNQSIGLRLQGRASRREDKKPFTLTARVEYGGSNVFDVSLFDGITSHSVMLKRYLTDVLAADIVADRDVSVLHTQPVRVYLNGEYWYDCYMTERYDQQFFRQYYQVSDRWLVKEGTPNEDTEDGTVQSAYDEYMYWVETADFSDPVQWEQFLEETDLQSYIDYMVINYYLCNVDMAEYTNYVVWRSSYEGNGPYEDARWRWCIYDIGALEWIPNYPEQYGSAEAVNLFSEEYMYSQMRMYNALKRVPEFCRRFVLSFMDIVNNNFRPESVQSVLEKYGMDLNWQNGFLRKRPQYATAYLAEEFGLTGTLETVIITTEDAGRGTVTVNTSQIDLSDGSWSGQYYTDYPITVTAQANPGYRFAGWKGDTHETGETITVSLDGGAALEAVFLPE